MNRIFQVIVLIVVLLSNPSGNRKVSAAPLNEQASLTFSNLGLASDIVMHGPYDARNIRFDLPATWSLTEGAELELVISAYFAGESGTLAGDDDLIGAALDVYFNDRLQQSVALRSGTDITYSIPITADDLPSPYPGGWFKVSFFLNAAIDCDFEFHQTTVSIGMNSRANLPYTEVPLPLDLHRIPWPIYQEQAIKPNQALVVLPSSPSAEEIRAALLVMGTFGMMTNGRFPVQLITADAVTDELRVGSHLFLVGKPAGLPILNSIPLQAAINSNRYVVGDLSDDDGYIEMAISPWNKERAILVVGGNTDQAVVKAAQALSTNNLQTGSNSAYSIVAEVNPVSLTGIIDADSNVLPPPDFSLADLGYASNTVSDIGTNWFSFDFLIAPGQVPSETPNLNLQFSHSALLDVNRSDVSVYINDTLAGSVKLSEDEYNLVTTQVKFPVSSLQPGVNNISISANLIPRDDCSISTYSGLWMTIYPESTLHLPLISAPITTTNFQDLSYYPYPFINDPSLSSTMFVLPPDDRLAWAIAGNMAYDLGRNSTGSILNLNAAYDGVLPEGALAQDLIIIGQPQSLQIITDLKDSMPGYFEEGSNLAVLESQQVIYKISSSKSLGYLELFPSPQDPEKVVLAILGTTPAGLQMANNALLTAQSREILNGDFATIDGDKPFVVDTRTGSGMGRVVTQIGQSNVTVEQNLGPSDVENAQIISFTGRQSIIIWLVGIVLLMVLVVVIAFARRRRTR